MSALNSPIARMLVWVLPLAAFYVVMQVASIDLAIVVGGAALAAAFYVDMKNER